jgi:hypothetical protein
LLHCTSKQPKIILYPDGKVVATGTNARINRHTEDHDADRIENFNDEDAQLFNEWIASVPMPNAWQRTK